MVSAWLFLLLGMQQHTGPAVPPPPGNEKVIAVRSLFSAPGGVLVWLVRNDAERVTAGGFEPFLAPIELERFPEPMGDGVWVQLLSAHMVSLGAFRTAVPPPGGRCALELPVVRGTWWLLVLERHHGDTKVLGQLQVGPELARLVKSHPIPVQ